MSKQNHSRAWAARLLAAGTLLASTGKALADVRYVDLNSTNPMPPYTLWVTAATNIQDAVDAAVAGDEIVVTNGLYAIGGRATASDLTVNRVMVDKPVSLLSVHGPQSTTIDGAQSVRCVYLTNGASLSGFTLTNGYAFQGGGLWCESTNVLISNCTLTGNSAYNGGGAANAALNNCSLNGNRARFAGGGAASSTLNNCSLNGNSAGDIQSIDGPSGGDGGGAFACTLNNCTLSGNSALSYSISSGRGGGACYSTLNNCIVYFNGAQFGANYWSTDLDTLNHCCTTPLPARGLGNITSDPMFVDTNGWANLRLQLNSSCINAGLSALAPAGPDLDDNPRIKGGTVDIGAYEFQSPASMISYAWLQQYALPTDGSADTADPDGEGLNNWQEWRCGTDPTNALSALRLLAPAVVGSGLVVRWESVADRTYSLERSTTASSGFTTLATGIPGQPGTTTYTDNNAIGAGPFFYRVGVSAP